MWIQLKKKKNVCCWEKQYLANGMNDIMGVEIQLFFYIDVPLLIYHIHTQRAKSILPKCKKSLRLLIRETIFIGF